MTTMKLKDRGRGHIWINVRDGIVVGAMGSDPQRLIGLTLERATHVARHGA